MANNKEERRTVDLSAYPDLVGVYLGMRVNRLTGIKTLFGFGPRISASVAAQPDGLLFHQNMVYSLFPTHFGMRQYWRDAESLLKWTRSDPHRQWWQQFLKNSAVPVSGTKPTSARRHGSELRRYSGPLRLCSLRSGGAGPRADVRRSKTGRQRTAGPPVITEEELYGEKK